MTEDLTIMQMQIGPMANFVYVIGCAATGEAAVVDPGWDAAAILRGAAKAGFAIRTMIVTHSHMDHVNALAALRQEVEATVYVHSRELSAIQRIDAAAVAVEDGAEVALGDHKVVLLHTPGHTPGSQCLLVQGRVLTGDTLFNGSIGRSDLPGSSPTQLFESLNRLKALDPATVVLPGHNYGERRSSTIEHELRTNPFLRIPTLADFLRLQGI